MEIAVATQTAPAQWRDESDAVLATVIQVLKEQSAQLSRAARR